MPVGSKLDTIWGVGLTVIVNDLSVPKQPLACGSTVKFACSGNTPVFMVLNDTIFPFPDNEGSPNAVLLFVQL